MYINTNVNMKVPLFIQENDCHSSYVWHMSIQVYLDTHLHTKGEQNGSHNYINSCMTVCRLPYMV